MITIDQAIEESKLKQNVSDGGSPCYDFGDVVLVKYSDEIQYLRNGERARDKYEDVIEVANEKNARGINIPKHYDIRRITEGDYDICYVLEQKCPGVSCTSMSKYVDDFSDVCTGIKRTADIPFEHYKKLISDGMEVNEMMYEAKEKNMFYDPNSGFWYIDFLGIDQQRKNETNQLVKEFETLKYTIIEPDRLVPELRYKLQEQMTPKQKEEEIELLNGIRAKTLLAAREVFPGFQKYEKFYLYKQPGYYKDYLMRRGIVNTDLNSLSDEDYETYNELSDIVIDKLVEDVTSGREYWDIRENSIRNRSNLFCLRDMWGIHKDNGVNPEDFEDEYYYEMELNNSFDSNMMKNLVTRLKQVEPNENIQNFLKEAEKYTKKV